MQLHIAWLGLTLALVGCSGEPTDAPDATADVIEDSSADIADSALPDTDDGTDTDAEPDSDDDTDVDADPPGRCGDGQLDDGEACDDGEANSDDTPDACRLDCTLARCGDGVVDSGEACDEDAASCDASCQLACEDACDEWPGPWCDGDIAVRILEGACVEGACVYTDEREDCAAAGGRCLEGACDLGPFAPRPNDVIITEIMNNPDALADTRGEWLELYNRSAVAIDLHGAAIEDHDGERYVFGSQVMAPGESLVFGRTTEALGDTAVDGVFDHFTLTNEADEVRLVNGDGETVDEIRYDGTFPAEPGASMQLGAEAYDVPNNVGERWCVTTATFSTGDQGTPGEVNGPCACEGHVDPVAGALINCQRATVGHIIDADTFDLISGDDVITVRLAGVNAPECHKSQTEVDGEQRGYCSSDDEFYGLAAYDETVGLLAAEEVRVTCDGAGVGGACPVGVFGRQLVYLELPDGSDFGASLVEAGAGFSYTDYPASRRATYCQREWRARDEGAGMWAVGTVDEVIALMRDDTQAWYADHDALCADAMSRYAEE